MRETPMGQTRRDVVRRCRTLVAIAAAAGGLLACGDERAAQGPADGPARPLVVVSVLPQAWFVDRIAEGGVRVVVMIPPGADPATLSPGFAELRSLAEAALYVKLGHPAFPFERAWLDAMISANERLRVVDLSLGIETVPDDPHYWVSPRHAHAIAAALASSLAEILPASRVRIDANRRRLDAEIDAVDALLRAQLEGRAGRRFLVFHPAWGYLAREYGLTQVAIERGGKSPGARALARQIEWARQAGVEIVFTQPQGDDSAAEVIAAEIGARVEVLDPLAYDWAANLRAVGPALARGLVP
jgi:zinc transport system substrate-binding protein